MTDLSLVAPKKRDKAIVVSEGTHLKIVRICRREGRTMKSQLAVIIGEYLDRLDKT